jgi:hypothetical protein
LAPAIEKLTFRDGTKTPFQQQPKSLLLFSQRRLEVIGEIPPDNVVVSLAQNLRCYWMDFVFGGTPYIFVIA